MDLRRALIDPDLVAVLHDLRPLVYAHGGVPEQDVPGHVRAASGIRRHAERLDQLARASFRPEKNAPIE